MKCYRQETEFTFGKYNGEIMRTVILKDPQYIDWCIMNLDHFTIDVMEFEEDFPKFPLTEVLIAKINLKTKKLQRKSSHNEPCEEEYGSTYSEYNGSYAQDVMGFSDDVINDAFEGDPDMYWNID